MSSIPYKLKRTITGGYCVAYQCPKCREGLRSGMKEVGTKIKCPSDKCSGVFVVPGIEDREKLALAEARAKEKKAEKKKINIPPKAAPAIEMESSEPELVPQVQASRQPWQSPKVSIKSSGPGPIERDVTRHQWVANAFRTIAYVVIVFFSVLPILGYVVALRAMPNVVEFANKNGANLDAGEMSVYSTLILITALVIVFLIALPYFWLSSVLHVLCKIAIAAERNSS